jgi:hypothetical protein
LTAIELKYGLRKSIFFTLQARAADCPDLTGKYEYATITQQGCEKVTLTQHRPTGDVTDEILLDNVYRVLPSMPQLKTAFTYNEYQLIGNSKDANGDLVRIFMLSLDKNGDQVTQRIVLNGKGDIVSTGGWTDRRQP